MAYIVCIERLNCYKTNIWANDMHKFPYIQYSCEACVNGKRQTNKEEDTKNKRESQNGSKNRRITTENIK